MFVSLLFLIATETFSFELFVVAFVIGLLVVYEITTPIHIQPRWQRRLYSIIAISLVMFGYVSARRIISLLPSGGL
jgi:multisubunit Na+/H+ antiporter MnhE subunit